MSLFPSSWYSVSILTPPVFNSVGSLKCHPLIPRGVHLKLKMHPGKSARNNNNSNTNSYYFYEGGHGPLGGGGGGGGFHGTSKLSADVLNGSDENWIKTISNSSASIIGMISPGSYPDTSKAEGGSKAEDFVKVNSGGGPIDLGNDTATSGGGGGKKKKKKKKPKIPWVLANCPKSLRFIVKFYRCFGFSFSGIIFAEHANSNGSRNRTKPGDKNLTGKTPKSAWFKSRPEIDEYDAPEAIEITEDVRTMQRKLSSRLRRGLYLCYNSLICLGMLGFFYYMIASKLAENSSEAAANKTADEVANTTKQIEQIVSKLNESLEELPVDDSFRIDDLFDKLANVNQNKTDIDQLKPILKGIIQSLVYVLMLDVFIIMLYALWRGGPLIHKLTKIPNIDQFDSTYRYAARSLGIMIVVSLVINVLGLVAFNGGQLEKFSEEFIASESGKKVRESTLKNTVDKIMIVTYYVLQVVLYVLLSLVPILFIYTMMLFRYCIKKLLDTFATVNLDEINMLKLKIKLTMLNERFKEIIPYFAIPLTVSFASNIFIIISSACFLMINTNRNQYTSFVFSIGLFAFLRLIVIACAGNLATNVCRDLIRTVYENLEQWNLNEWMCFMELKRLRKEFTVSVFSMYTVRQSSILTMLGFALNYIVILLQTENYSSSSNSTDTSNSTNATNLTSLTTELYSNTSLVPASFKSGFVEGRIKLFNWFDQS